MKLTEQKAAYAAENHGLVYSFLKEHGLPEDEYYDTVIFAFLNCVIKDTGGDFKTHAYKAMEMSVSAAEKSLAEEAKTVSLYDTADFGRTFEESLADERDEITELLERIRLKELLSCFERNERIAVKLLLDGFSLTEIARELQKSGPETQRLIHGIRLKTVSALAPNAA